MKKRPLPYFLAAVIMLFAAFLISTCESNSNCDLPAPKDVKVTVTGSTTALLEWTSVPNVIRYQVTVIDTTANTSFDTLTDDTKLSLTGLVQEHIYKAEVRSVCEDGKPSANVNSTSWKQSTIIIGDIVVMGPGIGTGMYDCICDSLSIPIVVDSDPTAPITFPLDYGTSQPGRAIYKIKVTNGSAQGYIKLAFDESCNTLKINRDSCGLDGIEVGLDPAINSTSVKFYLSGNSTEFMTLTPSFNSANSQGIFDLDFSGCGSCEFNYARCYTDWEGDCDG